jgi:hypothetical protein
MYGGALSASIPISGDLCGGRLVILGDKKRTQPAVKNAINDIK